ncbi:MAG: hypothetical protein RL770_2226 [Pseudomonadota bacterium]
MLQVLPTFDDVLAAAARLEGVAHKTPVMHRSQDPCDAVKFLE